MTGKDWTKEFPAEIMVCDTQGIIIEMNAEAEELFEDDGGRGLLGANALECHPAPAREKFERMLAGKISNLYISQENGTRRLFYQAPWYKDGQFAGFVEISFEVPDEIPLQIHD